MTLTRKFLVRRPDRFKLLGDAAFLHCHQREIKTYQVAQNEFPNSIEECSSWIITGSPASCYEDKEWIHKLSQFIRDCHSKK